MLGIELEQGSLQPHIGTACSVQVTAECKVRLDDWSALYWKWRTYWAVQLLEGYL